MPNAFDVVLVDARGPEGPVQHDLERSFVVIQCLQDAQRFKRLETTRESIMRARLFFHLFRPCSGEGNIRKAKQRQQTDRQTS